MGSRLKQSTTHILIRIGSEAVMTAYLISLALAGLIAIAVLEGLS